MAKRKKYESWMTTDSIIRSALRKVWLWSRERKAAIDRTYKCCEVCGAKQSKAKGREVKIEVHHIKMNVNWDRIFKIIREELLVNPRQLKVLCKKCHYKLHNKERKD